MSQKENNNMDKHFYRASAADFNKIPGSPIAYWIGPRTLDAVSSSRKLGEIGDARMGLATGNNSKYVRLWFETSIENIGFSCADREDAKKSKRKWFPYCKGGAFRKWFGNNEYIVDWFNDGQELQTTLHPSGSRVWAHNFNLDHIFEDSITWSDITSGRLSVRFNDSGFLFDGSGTCAFFHDKNEKIAALGFLNTNFANDFSKVLNPTMHFQTGDFRNMPYGDSLLKEDFINGVKLLINKAKNDWNSYENSWEFSKPPLLQCNYNQQLLTLSYQELRTHWYESTLEMQHLEVENNRIFINAYGLQDEQTPEVPLKEITLTCNPYYRYGNNKTVEELEAMLQSDTMTELISFTIGCMMGRYSLNREGLVYAHAGNEGFKTLVEEGAYTRFPADVDGILPLTTEAWFEDDIAARVVEFVRTVWGVEHLEENLQFIADSLCLAAIKPVKKGGETSRETIRRYLSTQFFKDHLKTYKKRPIYWLFSSGKEKAFECLVYLHRYNETTLPRMRTEYVTPLLGQMDSRIERLRLQQNEAETAEAKRIGKEIDSLTKQLTELRAFDDQLKHYADMKIQLDLDDGVKVNYGKFGTLLAEVKAITGDKTE
ncbi:BREX-1 system adenine-specific DNA-methyltransferase PglX [Yersinia enterocolitica]|uniref:BREX-1 system adenine-specific DNA-methyltransferase PglX n=1 Tax=Yersinia enterocolitica TaxID=630 RepID=UPI0033097E99|nr:BREX-1 system adenine-specific DNA-methyltransferase PglX [Yersinia enterocolitica]